MNTPRPAVAVAHGHPLPWFTPLLIGLTLAVVEARAEIDVFEALERYADSQPARPAPPKRTIFTPPVPPKPAARQLITTPRWLENGHGATVSHLISAHGFSRSQLAGLSQRQLDDLHSDAHNRARSRTVTRTTTSACPSGNCPNTSVRRGIFRRR